MHKRGQITIFIIIAIILIAVIILFFVLRDSGKETEIIPVETAVVKGFVESCIEGTGKDAILFISRNGGYFLTHEFSTEEGIPYYYFNGRSYMPSKERVEAEISNYMNSLLSFCTNGFDNFPDLNITEREITARVEIRDREVVFNVNYPISIQKGESVSTIEDFKDIRIHGRIGIIYDAVGEIITEQIKNEGICLDCLSEIASRDNLKIDMISIEEGIIFTVRDRDERFKIKEAALEWKFVSKYE